MIPQIADTGGHEVPPAARAGHLPPVVSRPFINATGGLSYEAWRAAILSELRSFHGHLDTQGEVYNHA